MWKFPKTISPTSKSDSKSKCPIEHDILSICVPSKIDFHNPEMFGLYAAFLSFSRNLNNTFRECLNNISFKYLSCTYKASCHCQVEIKLCLQI